MPDEGQGTAHSVLVFPSVSQIGGKLGAAGSSAVGQVGAGSAQRAQREAILAQRRASLVAMAPLTSQEGSHLLRKVMHFLLDEAAKQRQRQRAREKAGLMGAAAPEFAASGAGGAPDERGGRAGIVRLGAAVARARERERVQGTGPEGGGESGGGAGGVVAGSSRG